MDWVLVDVAGVNYRVHAIVVGDTPIGAHHRLSDT